MQITCRLFGSPMIYEDGTLIQFPYKKAEALFYYLLTVSSASRQELSSLLWPELSEAAAKKNLRNAIYKIKETFNDENILLTKRSSVSINPQRDIRCDIHDLPGAALEDIYQGEFLKDFSVKNAESFQQWLDSKREYYRQLYIDILHDEIDRQETNKDWKMMQLCSRKLTMLDEFDEKGYAGLIRSYHKQRAYDKAISAYKDLEKLLQSELGINPAAYIKEIFNELLDDMSADKDTKNIDHEKIFFDRYIELRALEKAWGRFQVSGESSAAIVSGERGSGKTRFIEEFLNGMKQSSIGSIRNNAADNEKLSRINDDNGTQGKGDQAEVRLMQLKCRRDDSDQPFRAWKTLIIQRLQQQSSLDIITEEEDRKNSADGENKTIAKELISLMKAILMPDTDEAKRYEDTESAVDMVNMRDMITDTVISYLFEKHSTYLIIIDDIHHMDDESMTLMDSIISNFKGVFLIASCDISEIDKIKMHLYSEDRISFIDLKRWTKAELLHMIQESLDEQQQALTSPDHMIYHTQGVAMFVQDYITRIKQGSDPEILSEDIKSRLDRMLFSLSKDERLLLDAASFFSDDADLGLLKAVAMLDEKRLSYAVDSLCRKHLIRECEYSYNQKENAYKINTYDSLIYIFEHPAIKEYVYSSQSMTIRRLKHQEIADLLEDKLLQKPSDMALYHRLIHHYMRAGNKSKALECSVKSLNRYLNYSHELFPILFAEDQALIGSGYMNTVSTLSYLDDIENLLKDVKTQADTKEYRISEIAFFHLKGRYRIREGEYEEGTMLIRKMIEGSLEIGDDDYALEGYKQMIYYCIQTGDADLMQSNIRLALDIAIKHNYHKETGIIMRFNGLYHMLRGEYEKAWQLLQSSVGTFTISDEVADKYALNIAAAYNYMGEIKRLEEQHEKAEEYYQKAIDIGTSKNAVTSLMVFYINAGQNEYQKGDRTAAREYFNKAGICQGRADIHWKKSILSSYTGLLEIEDAPRENKIEGSEQKDITGYEDGLKKIKQANEQALKMKNPQEIKIAAWALARAQEIISKKGCAF